MNKKFISMLEEGYLSGYVKDNAEREDIKNLCNCGTDKPGSKKLSNHKKNCAAVKAGLVCIKETIEEGRKPLSDEEKQRRADEKESQKAEKAKKKADKKSGKDDDDDDDDDLKGKEGVRSPKVTAYIKISGKKEPKVVKGDDRFNNITPDDFDKELKKWEKELYRKYETDEDEVDDIMFKDTLGWTGPRAEDMTKDDSGLDTEDDTYDVGSK